MDHATVITVLCLIGFVAMGVFCALMAHQPKVRVIVPPEVPNVTYTGDVVPRGARDWVG